MSASEWQVEGYAARWGGPFVDKHGGRYELAPKCFTWDKRKPPVWFLHRPDFLVLPEKSRSLQLWQDNEGLAFRISSRAMLSPERAWLREGIERRVFCELSAAFRPIAARINASPVGECIFVDSARVTEISVVMKGACPGTGMWFSRDGHDLDRVPHSVREVCATFQRQQALNPTPPPASWAPVPGHSCVPS